MCHNMGYILKAYYQSKTLMNANIIFNLLKMYNKVYLGFLYIVHLYCSIHFGCIILRCFQDYEILRTLKYLHLQLLQFSVPSLMDSSLNTCFTFQPYFSHFGDNTKLTSLNLTIGGVVVVLW